jgi:hypothetical protein
MVPGSDEFHQGLGTLDVKGTEQLIRKDKSWGYAQLLWESSKDES